LDTLLLCRVCVVLPVVVGSWRGFVCLYASYVSCRQGKHCQNYRTLMAVPHVKEALAAFGFDAAFIPAACVAS
jgi:hypothetical protein